MRRDPLGDIFGRTEIYNGAMTPQAVIAKLRSLQGVMYENNEGGVGQIGWAHQAADCIQKLLDEKQEKGQMRAIKELGLIIAVAGAMLLTGLALHGCDKVVPATPEAVTGKVGPQEPTTQLEKIGAVSVVTPTPASTVATSAVKVKAVRHGASAEALAYKKAYANAAAANAAFGAHVWRTGPKDETAIGSYPDHFAVARPCVSDVAS